MAYSDEVLRKNLALLYRRLLKEKYNLRYSDKEYFSSWIGNEFRKNKHLKDQREIRHVVNQGLILLRRSLGGLI